MGGVCGAHGGSEGRIHFGWEACWEETTRKTYAKMGGQH
jgi:hypothetical protein